MVGGVERWGQYGWKLYEDSMYLDITPIQHAHGY